MLNRWTLLDLETTASADCREWMTPIVADPRLVAELEAPIKADSRLTDPVKIAADLNKKQAYKDELPGRISVDIEQRTAVAIQAASLDADLCQIVAFGLQGHDDREPWIYIATDVGREAACLEDVWQHCNASTPMVGYGLMWFDLGVLMRRSQLLGVQVPSWVYRQGKYRHEQVIELADYLTLNGIIEVKKGRGLDYHCQRFGIHVDDVISGKDVPQAVADGRLEDVETHLRADLSRIQQLAQRLGVIPDNRTARMIPARETEEVF